MWHPSIEWFRKTELDKKNNMPIRLWTINSEEDLIYCFNKKVAGIFTDYPQKALTIRNGR